MKAEPRYPLAPSREREKDKRKLFGARSTAGTAIASLAVAVSLTTTVLATPTNINDVDLTAAQGVVFDPEHETYGCINDEDTRYYSPVGDGKIGIRTDGFDGALVLWVGDNAFTDADGVGNLVGQQLSVGPTKVSRVTVRRIERALPGSRTHRSLIKLTNPTRKTLRRSITLDTNLGSDGSTELELSSSGDPRFDSRDQVASTHGVPVAVQDVPHIDLVVCGTVAADRRGARVGKGGGFADLELGILTEAGAIDGRTAIVTTVHPLQVLDERLPETEHDFRVDRIVTPDETIRCRRARRPSGILWEHLDEERIASIPILPPRRGT